MNRQQVNSTNLKSVGYDPVSLTLEVEFQDQSLYEYYRVPARVHTGLLQASSIGAYFNKEIAKRYEFREIR